ncbi:hypothetical protein OIE13_34665 [Streptosporangium sp. NBC_01810]|uniref:hypothetical protein n=1 Tax=Streptosporangium sp. NBC_01810 TaxID=2975951 RepID=UPI002DDAF6FF|nr:hypothetical protein [Streptosporangium sp. NBC_01810]WSA25985.1 hypothetical protein OIE13_34665 [Streptosporangium sp. NBC_01810]
MAAGTQEEQQFIHLVRLGWDLRVLGVTTSLVIPAAGPPVLEISSTAGVEIRVRVIRRAWGWVFTWRPWWSVLWRRSEWVWAEDDFAANLIMAAVTV